jgi:hypothetical protein
VVEALVWRDPLDELIEELERALPPTADPSGHLPRLEDLQAVISPILFGTKEQQERLFADPAYQRLSDTVMRQLAGTRDNRPIEGAAPGADPHVGRSAPSPVNGQQSVSAGCPPAGFGICLCGADEDGAHAADCPLADANMW